MKHTNYKISSVWAGYFNEHVDGPFSIFKLTAQVSSEGFKLFRHKKHYSLLNTTVHIIALNNGVGNKPVLFSIAGTNHD